MAWRLAKSLGALRDAIDALAPGRDKSSDGAIGDAAHAARKSEHNPDADGVVRALDITHDPASGVDTRQLAEQLRQSRDQRILYVISHGRIFSSAVAPWEWRPYSGSNPHDRHMHVSVVADPAWYDDDASAWAVSLSAPAGAPQPLRPRLRLGDRGPDVEELQRLLGVAADGVFGEDTDAAVKAFQAARGLAADGVVGPYTWDALSSAQPPGRVRMAGIVATVFGGRSDPNRSAYDNHVITDDELGVALPYRFPPGERPKVTVMRAGRAVTAEIVDVGPWNTDDPYWLTGARPQAESGVDRRGRSTNRAGIDLTPAAARAIGLPGKGEVDWEFVGAQPSPPPALDPQALAAEIARLIKEAIMSSNVPAPFIDPTLIADAVLKGLRAGQPAAPPNPPVMSTIDVLLGGKAMLGKKTLLGIIGIVGALLGKDAGIDAGGQMIDIALTLFGSLVGAGLVAKVDRYVKATTEVGPKILDALTQLSAAIDRQKQSG